MARREEEDEAFQEQTPANPPPAKPRREENLKPGPPRPPVRRDEEDEEPEDRPRRREERRPRRRDDDAVSTLIPYRNGLALAGYYCGVFSLIPILGFILGPLALIFGIVGLRRVNRNPEIKGTGHAITAIVLGGIGGLYNWAIVILFAIGFFASRQ